MGAFGLYRCACDARQHAGLRHAERRPSSARIRRIAWAACRIAVFRLDGSHDEFDRRLADPRSFCIQKTLAGHRAWRRHRSEPDVRRAWAYKFGKDPFYSNGFVPTVKQLVDRILTGD
jgi:hypothetical protein